MGNRISRKSNVSRHTKKEFYRNRGIQMTHSVTLTVYTVINYETNITLCGDTQNFLMLQHVVTTNSQ